MRFYAIQKTTIKKLLTGENLGVFLEPGVGKTLTILEFLRLLIYSRRQKKKVLIVSTLRIVYLTWPAEILRWFPRYKRLTWTIMHGPLKSRNARKDKDIYLINREGLPWLLKHHKGKPWPYDILVIDESTKFKNYSTTSHKIIRYKYHTFDQVILLSGSPSPEGIQDLYAQLWLLDKGKRLGKTLKEFRQRFMVPIRKSYGEAINFVDYEPQPDAEKRIKKRIADITVVARAKDYVDLPKVVDNKVFFSLSEKTMGYYEEMLEKLAIEIEDRIVVSENAGGKYAKLRQISSGFIYDEGEPVPISNEKFEALKELLDEINKPTIIFYNFKPELEVLKTLKGSVSLDASMGMAKMEAIQDKWNAGKIPYLLLYPGESAHGLNIAKSCQHMVWYSLTDSGENFIQGIRRLERLANAGKQVFIHYMLAKGTMDESVVYERVTGKSKNQMKFMRSLKSYIRRRLNR